MLVINGVYAQTTSHAVGVVNNWSGHDSGGYPATMALFATPHASAPPVSDVTFRGNSETGGLTRHAPTCILAVVDETATCTSRSGFTPVDAETGRQKRDDHLPEAPQGAAISWGGRLRGGRRFPLNTNDVATPT